MHMNFLALFLAAASTLVVGFIWYNPKVFGTIWMKESGVNMEDGKNKNMIMIFGLSFVYAFLMSFFLQTVVIHQFGALGMVGGNADLAKPSYAAFMADYGDAFRYFRHGVIHGAMAGIFLIFPITATNALYEGKSFKYVMVSSGFWIVCFMIMGGIICAMK